jgi:hypothetical protein
MPNNLDEVEAEADELRHLMEDPRQVDPVMLSGGGIPGVRREPLTKAWMEQRLKQLTQARRDRPNRWRVVSVTVDETSNAECLVMELSGYSRSHTTGELPPFTCCVWFPALMFHQLMWVVLQQRLDPEPAHYHAPELTSGLVKAIHAIGVSVRTSGWRPMAQDAEFEAYRQLVPPAHHLPHHDEYVTKENKEYTATTSMQVDFLEIAILQYNLRQISQYPMTVVDSNTAITMQQARTLRFIPLPWRTHGRAAPRAFYYLSVAAGHQQAHVAHVRKRCVHFLRDYRQQLVYGDYLLLPLLKSILKKGTASIAWHLKTAYSSTGCREFEEDSVTRLLNAAPPPDQLMLLHIFSYGFHMTDHELAIDQTQRIKLSLHIERTATPRQLRQVLTTFIPHLPFNDANDVSRTPLILIRRSAALRPQHIDVGQPLPEESDTSLEQFGISSGDFILVKPNIATPEEHPSAASTPRRSHSKQ